MSLQRDPFSQIENPSKLPSKKQNNVLCNTFATEPGDVNSAELHCSCRMLKSSKTHRDIYQNKKATILEIDPDFLDSNGRPFRFDSLFGNTIPTTKDASHKKKKTHRHQTTATTDLVNRPRLSNCLSQLGPPIEDRFDFGLDRDQSYQCRRVEQKVDENYLPGISNPWSSIDFNVSEGIQVNVSHRTRVDCGLPPRRKTTPVPTRRQQRALDAAYEVELLEERSKVLSDKSALFIEKSRELEQRRQGNRGGNTNNTIAQDRAVLLQHQKSALSLNYLN